MEINAKSGFLSSDPTSYLRPWKADNDCVIARKKSINYEYSGFLISWISYLIRDRRQRETQIKQNKNKKKHVRYLASRRGVPFFYERSSKRQERNGSNTRGDNYDESTCSTFTAADTAVSSAAAVAFSFS